MSRQQRKRTGVGAKKHETVGDYIVGRKISGGTSGTVYAGKHMRTGQKVAIKVIQSEKLDENAKIALKREIAVLRLLKHENIVGLIDVYNSSRHIFIVQEYVSGGELFEYIVKCRKLPRAETLRIMSQIIKAVEYCHLHNICHRDLKPENILLDHQNNIKICDFGYAQIASSNSLQTFCGSPHYGSPEIVLGLPYDGRISDVWSIGVVFYASITGLLPFDHQNTKTLLNLVKKGQYEIPNGVDSDIEDLLRKMLCKDVNQRIKSHEIRNHPVWLNDNGINTYFPDPTRSEAYDLIASHPINTPEQLRSDLLDHLLGLGWNRETLIETIIEQSKKIRNAENLHDKNIEIVFYMSLLAQRPESLQLLNNNNNNKVGNDVEYVRNNLEKVNVAGSIIPPERQAPQVGSFRERKKFRKNLGIKTTRDRDIVSESAHPVANTPTRRRVNQRDTHTPLPSTDTNRNVRLPSEYGNDQFDHYTPREPFTPSVKKSWFGRFRESFRRKPRRDSFDYNKYNNNVSNQPHRHSVDYQQRQSSSNVERKVPDSSICTDRSVNKMEQQILETLNNLGISATSESQRNGIIIECAAICRFDPTNLQIKVVNNPDSAYQRDITPHSPSHMQQSPPEVPQMVRFRILLSNQMHSVLNEEHQTLTHINFDHFAGHMDLYGFIYCKLTTSFRL